MLLTITPRGERRLKQLALKVQSGGATEEERRMGGFLDYVETWAPIDTHTDEFFTDPAPDTMLRTRTALKKRYLQRE